MHYSHGIIIRTRVGRIVKDFFILKKIDCQYIYSYKANAHLLMAGP